MKILVVEDDKNQNKVLCQILRNMQHEVLSATDGVDMVSVLSEDHVDLVLTDIQMPNLDGVDAAEYIHNEMHLDTPVIGITGLPTGDPLLKKCIGVFRCLLRKPLILERLCDEIAKIRKRHSRGRNDEY